MTVTFASFGRHFDGTFAVQILGSQRMRLQHLSRSTGKDNLSAQPARFRPHINNIIGSKHHILIMLHHDNRVAHIAQLFQ